MKFCVKCQKTVPTQAEKIGLNKDKIKEVIHIHCMYCGRVIETIQRDVKPEINNDNIC
jgi:DNA-directed RNA polymerase subunit RPC12/RpoP